MIDSIAPKKISSIAKNTAVVKGGRKEPRIKHPDADSENSNNQQKKARIGSTIDERC